MGVPRRLVLTVISVAALLAGSTGGVSAAAAAAGSSGADPLAAQAVAAAGLDPAAAVVQRGARNYAGPHCPGAGWQCTTSDQVVQVSTDPSSVSYFVCRPRASTANSARANCRISQIGTGRHVATCTEQADNYWNSATCVINQTVTAGGGSNYAFVTQQLGQNKGTHQELDVRAEVDQTTVSGSNNLTLNQQLTQAINESSVHVDQHQDADVDNDVSQTSHSGANRSDARQSISQDEQATTGQDGTQVQESDFLAHLLQQSAGLSTSVEEQTESQNQHAPDGSSVAQEQVGPFRCCSNQVGNPDDRIDVRQASTQVQSPGGSQTQDMVADCSTAGLCTANQSYTRNGETETESCSDSSCHISIEESCDYNECGSESLPYRPPAGRQPR